MVSLNTCSIRPCSLQSLFHSPPPQTAGQRNGVWKIQALPSVVGWDTSPWKRMGKNTAALYSWATRALHFRQKPCQCSEKTKSTRDWTHGTHLPSIRTTWCSKGSGLLAILSFKQIPKDDETLLMQTVNSVVLTDLQFHQLNSAYWGFTQLLIEYRRHCKSQLKRWTQPVLLMSVFPVTVDFIRHWANSCWHPIGMPFSSIPGPDRDCLDMKSKEEIWLRNSTISLGNASIYPCIYYDD